MLKRIALIAISALLLVAASASARTVPAIGVGGGLTNCGQTPSPDMGTVRIILYDYEPLNIFYACAQQAVAADKRLLVSVQYDPSFTIAQDRVWFQQALALYAPLHPYAISVGNEEEFDSSARQYVRVWRGVEPLIARTDPRALRVAGEISPWHIGWLAKAARLGLPGVQVFAGHAYPNVVKGVRYGFTPAQLATLANTYHVRPWITEGICGPGAWTKFGCVSRSSVAKAGIKLAIEWYAPTAISTGTNPTA